MGRSIPAALLSLALLASCGSRETSGTVVLDFWALGREGEVVQQLLPEFERAHPGVRVSVQQIPWTAAHEKLLTAYVGRQTPDLVQMGNTWIPEFAAVGALEPLDPWIARSREVRADEYFPGIWDTNVVDGTVYGVPWYVDTRVLFYRTDLLASVGHPDPPRTWDEWRQVMERIQQRAGPNQFAIVLPTDEWAQPVILGLQQGSPLLRDGGRYGAFEAPPFARAAEFYVGLFRDGLAPARNNAQVGNVYLAFARGDFAMYITGPWNLGEFRRRLPANVQNLWTTAPLPNPRAGEAAPGVSLAGGSSVALFRSSRHKTEAFALLEFLSGAARQSRFYALTGDLPARVSAWDDPLLAGDPQAQAFRLQLQHVMPAPKVPEWEQIAQLVAEHLEVAIRGRTTVAQALTTLDRTVDRALDKRRWVLDRRGGAGSGETR